MVVNILLVVGSVKRIPSMVILWLVANCVFLVLALVSC